MFVKGHVMLEVESPNTLPNIFIIKFSYIIFLIIEVDFRKRKKQMEWSQKGKKIKIKIKIITTPMNINHTSSNICSR